MRNSRWHAWVLVLPALVLHLSLHAQTLHPNADVAHAASPNELFTFSHPAMGTTYTLYLYAASGQIAEQEADRAFTIIDDLDSLLSNYKPQSELSRINQQAFTAAVTTDPETFAFLARSLYWSEQSDGAFDISVGALMKAWGFFRSSGHLPSAEELAEVQTRTGWKRVLLDPATRGVRFTNAGVELDPGGIGKGFAVDRVVEMLRKDGVHAALLSAGSSTIYALGSPPGRAGWNIDIPDPLDARKVLSTVVLKDTSLSSASCSVKHFVLEGHLYCHIMDPRLLRPVEGRLQVSVISPSATDGDALSNVFFVGDAPLRTRVMSSLEPGSSALVLSGVPSLEDTASNAASGDRHSDTCESYRWPAPVQGQCIMSSGKKESAASQVKENNR